MHILNIVGAYPPAYVHGGPVHTTHNLSKALMALGHEVLVLTTDICGQERLDVPNWETTWDGVPVQYCRWIKAPIPYLSLELAHKVRKRASEFDVALISSSWTGYGVMSGFECRRAGLPYVMYAHGSYAPFRLKKSWLKKKIWWWALDKHLYNNAAAVVALTKAEISQVRSMGVRTRIEYIPNGVDIEGLNDGLDRTQLETLYPQLRGRRYFLFLGRLEPIKGLDVLIPAFSHILSQLSDIMLVIAGPDERGYVSTVRELVQKHGVQERVVFTGMVTGKTKVGLLRNANLFVLTSYGEGMSIATLEAMACGTPVLITYECNMPEVAEAEAGIVVSLSVEDVAAGLREVLLHSPKFNEHMGKRGKQLVAERFTWERVALRTSELCEEIVSDRLSPIRANKIL